MLIPVLQKQRFTRTDGKTTRKKNVFSPSDGHGITIIRDVMALISRSVRAMLCCIVCITLDDVSFKFLRKLPAPPFIDENNPPPPMPMDDDTGTS